MICVFKIFLPYFFPCSIFQYLVLYFRFIFIISCMLHSFYLFVVFPCFSCFLVWYSYSCGLHFTESCLSFIIVILHLIIFSIQTYIIHYRYRLFFPVCNVTSLCFCNMCNCYTESCKNIQYIYVHILENNYFSSTWWYYSLFL